MQQTCMTYTRANDMAMQMRQTNEAGAWSAPTRVAFRFVFCLLGTYALCCGHKTIFSKIPRVGASMERAMNHAFLLPAQWVAVHMLRLSGAAATLHTSAFADRALDWIAAGLMLALACLATLVWSLADRRSCAYPKLNEALRWLLRMTLVISLMWYAAIKLFPIQIEQPSLAVLNERVGDLSPMTLLWTLLGVNPLYEQLCGALEMICALLLLWRRTTRAGVLLAIVLLSNILLFDLFFDVAVRLYAGMLLAMALTLLAPDAPALWGFCVTNRQVRTRGTWTLAHWPLWAQRMALVFEIYVALTIVKPFVGLEHHQYAQERAYELHTASIAGQWHITSAVDPDTHAAVSLASGDGTAQTDLFLEPSGRVNLRSGSGRLWGGSSYDPTAHTVGLMSAMHTVLIYHDTQPDPEHLVLTPENADVPVLTLVRVPLPNHYPLLDRLHEHSWHLVEEWGFFR
jgi:hypothetical protein